MTFSHSTKVTVGILIAMAPAAFWVIGWGYSVESKADAALSKAEKVQELRDIVIEIKNDVKWLKERGGK